MENNGIKSKANFFSLHQIMIQRSLHSTNKTLTIKIFITFKYLSIMELNGLQTVFKAAKINKQLASVTVFVGNNKNFEENNYTMSENITICTHNGNRRQQFEQDAVNMSIVFDRANVSLVSEPRSVFC